MTKDDKILELLTEIRDFQKQQLVESEKVRKAKNRSTLVRIVLYGVVFIFSGFAAFNYYKTLVSVMGG